MNHELIRFLEIESKTPPFKQRRTGHPPVQNHSKPGPPAPTQSSCWIVVLRLWVFGCDSSHPQANLSSSQSISV